jgi:hypothetical protein
MEQERVAKNKSAGKKKVANRRWMKSVGNLKTTKAQVSQGAKLKATNRKKHDLRTQLRQIHLPSVIVPRCILTK